MIGKRVLVVEDTRTDEKRSACCCKGGGIASQRSGSAEEATTRAPAFHPESIVLDLALESGTPDCDVIRQLRARIGGAVHLVVYSGYRDLEGRAREAGCDDYIVKPNVEALEALFGEPGTPPAGGR